jgi:hypothetical protein
MMTPKQYRECAADCVAWANESSTDGLREAFLVMARHWIEIAERAERSFAPPQIQDAAA